MEIKDRIDNDTTDKVHQWRRCGRGEHLVREHPVHVPPSKKHPEGKDSVWHEHCAKNASGKDELSYAEIKYISATYFSDLQGLPTADVLTKEFSDADKYDAEIRGWTQYWDDIFSWEETIEDYKAILALRIHNQPYNPKPMEDFKKYYKILSEG